MSSHGRRLDYLILVYTSWTQFFFLFEWTFLTLFTSLTWNLCLITWHKWPLLWNTSAFWVMWHVLMSWSAWKRMKKIIKDTGEFPGRRHTGGLYSTMGYTANVCKYQWNMHDDVKISLNIFIFGILGTKKHEKLMCSLGWVLSNIVWVGWIIL